MNKKINFKTYLLKAGIVSFVLLTIFIFICNYEYRVYTNNFNNKIDQIVTKILEKYPNVTENEIILILNNDESNSELFEKYGIDLDTQSILIENDNYYNYFILLKVIFFVVIIFFFLFFLFYV